MLSLWIASAAIRAQLADPGGAFSGSLKVCKQMVCALSAESMLESPAGEVAPVFANEQCAWTELGDRPFAVEELAPAFLGETADGDDPFDDFDEDDFDDDFDDDFEEDWEDDLTEDDEFPDTFGGNDPEEEIVESEEEDEDSPFADDPDFDDA